MFCDNCGNELRDGAKFCNKCGAAVVEKLTTDALTAAERSDYSQEPESVEKTPCSKKDISVIKPDSPVRIAETKASPRRKKTIKIAIIAISLMLVVAVALAIVFNVFAKPPKKQAVFQEYKKIVVGSLDGIKGFQKETGNNGTALYDIDGDQTPELFFVEKADDGYDLTYVYKHGDTAKSEKICTLHSFVSFLNSSGDLLYIYDADEDCRYLYGCNASGQNTVIDSYDAENDSEEKLTEFEEKLEGFRDDEVTVVLNNLSEDEQNQLFGNVVGDASHDCDEMIAYLDGEETDADQKPTETGLTESEILQLYKKELEANEKKIREYEPYGRNEGYLEENDDIDTVAVYDIFGDETPELLYVIKGKDSKGNDCPLIKICGIVDDSVQVLYSSSVSYAPITDIAVLIDSDAEQVYLFADFPWKDMAYRAAYRLTYKDKKIELSESLYYEHLLVINKDLSHYVDYTCRKDGKGIEKEVFDQYFEDFENSIDTSVLFCGKIFQLPYSFKHAKSVSMTYDEALDYIASYEQQNTHTESVKNETEKDKETKQETTEAVSLDDMIEIYAEGTFYHYRPQKDCEYVMPLLKVSSDDANSFNQEMKELYDGYLEIIKNSSDPADYMDVFYGFSYEAAINDNLLSLCIKRDNGLNSFAYYVINIDLSTGKKVDNDTILDHLGVTFDEIREDIRSSLKTAYMDVYGGSYNNSESSTQEYCDQSFTDENIEKVSLYLGDDRILYGAFPIYYMIQSGWNEMTVKIDF